MSEIKICEYTKDDRMGCIRLLKDTFPGLSGEENFAWRFESSRLNAPLMVCAKHNDDVVGFHSWLPWRFTYDNRQYIGYQGGEAATDKHYLRQGIQNRIVNYGCTLALEKNIDFIFGGGGHQATLKSYYNSGFYQVANFPIYQRIVRPFLKKCSEAKLVKAKKPLKMMLREEKKITPIVDDNYMEWRYSMNPKDYSVVEIEKDNSQAQFCVRKRRLPIRKLRIKTNDLLVLDCQFSSLNDRFIKWAFNCLESLYSGNVMTISTYLNENTDRGRAISRYFTFKGYYYKQGLMFLPIKKDLDLNVFLNQNNWDWLTHLVDWY